jgi:hypothetical protein
MPHQHPPPAASSTAAHKRRRLDDIEEGAIVLDCPSNAAAAQQHINVTPDDGSATALQQLPRAEIERIVVEIATWHDPRPEARHGRYSRLYPEFMEAYPRLFMLCCSAPPPHLMSMLKLMLDQRDAALASTSTQVAEACTQQVHDALRAQYVDPVIAAADAAAAAAAAQQTD